MKSTTKKRATYHHGDLRAALIEAALAGIDEVGVERFTLRDAARRAGVSAGAPYRHFPDKDALIAAVAAECSQRLGAAMDRAAEESSGGALERFRKSGVAYVCFAIEHPAHFRAMAHPAVAKYVSDLGGVEEWMQEMAAELGEAQARGELTAAPVSHIMLFTHSLVHGLARLVIDDPRFHGLTTDGVSALASALTDLAGVGILPR